MKIGSTFNHEIYGPLTITGKRYSRMGNKSLWIGTDEQGETHELDGSEKPAKAEKTSPKFLKEAAEMFGMTQGPQGEKGIDADEEAIIQAVFEKVLPLIPTPENGKDGADADTELIVRELLPLVMEKMPRPKELNEALIIQKVVSRIRIPQDGKPGEKGKDGSPDTPSQVKEKLETLKGDERLDASAIKNLPKPTMQFGGDSYTGLAKIDSAGTPGTLEDKIVAGTNVTITKVNDTLRIAASGGGGSGTVETIVAGNNIDVDATDPANPIVSVETLTLADISDVTASATELNYVDGVTSGIQAQLDGKQASDADLTALAGLAATGGMLARTGAGAFSVRTIAGTANEITLTNGDGVSGAPTVSLPATIDLGGKTSFEIPNGAGGTTVDAAGEICVDTTSDTLNFFDGTVEGVLNPIQSKTITIESPTAAEDLSMFYTDDAITITKIVFVITGSTSATTTIRHHTDRSNAGNEVVTGGTTANSTTTGNVVTSFNDATVPADSFVWLETTALSGTPTSLSVTIFYRQDA